MHVCVCVCCDLASSVHQFSEILLPTIVYSLLKSFIKEKEEEKKEEEEEDDIIII